MLQVGWSRCGEDIVYFQNQYYALPALPKRAPPAKKGQSGQRDAGTSSLYTLSFLMTFPLAGDIAYISQCYPFTCTMQQRDTTQLCAATTIEHSLSADSKFRARATRLLFYR